jgi:plastocyanin
MPRFAVTRLLPMPPMNSIRPCLFAALFAAVALPALAASTEATLVIKNHRFEPAELKVAAGQRIKLIVHNQDSSAEEFESHPLKAEKVIAGGAKATLYVGPLKPGRYPFVGEFHEATAKGVLIAE